MAMRIIEAATRPGAADRPNEDALAADAERGVALVVDGATGLGDERFIAEAASDAAWLAQRAAARLCAGLAEGRDMVALVRAVNAETRATLAERLGGEAAFAARPRYARPTAGFQAARLLADGALEVAGLGDCGVLALDGAGRFFRASGQARARGAEQAAAREAIAAYGALEAAGVARRKPEVMAGLRAARDRHNTPGGEIWTLGPSVAAAEHVRRALWRLARPATLLLATDGLLDLIDNYGAYDGPGLVQAARRLGLEALIDAARRIEAEVDPSGRRFPRFKRSDDATALLIALA